MTLELSAIPLAFVWLALGLSLAFAVAGTALTWILVSTGTDPELFRYVAASVLLVLGVVLLVPWLANQLTSLLARASGRLGAAQWASSAEPTSAPGHFAVGALLGVVWLPCVGPTLGAAIGLGSLGQNMPMAFVVMLAYGVGTAGVLLGAGLLSGRLLARWRPHLAAGGQFGKKLLGGTVLLLGLLVLTGVDKILEALAIGWLPGWMFTL